LWVARLVESFEHQLNLGEFGLNCIKIDIKFALIVMRSVAHERPW